MITQATGLIWTGGGPAAPTCPTLQCPPIARVFRNALSLCYLPVPLGSISLGSPVPLFCSGQPTIVNDAPSSFGVGATIVQWTATVGNDEATCTQLVSVNDDYCPGERYCCRICRLSHKKAIA